MFRKVIKKIAVACIAIGALTTIVGVDLNAANPSATLDQWANLNNQWVNGNLGASKSTYFEGDSIPYRLTFANLPLTTHTVVIEWDTTKSSKHALDYLTTFNYRVGKTLNAPNPPLNPCFGVSGCDPAAFDTEDIPVDPNVGATIQVPGVFTLYGGTISSLTAADYAYTNGGSFTGDNSTSITITFTATVANPVLTWGGHIATRKDWGNGNSAVAIPGSPYHTRLLDLDGAGGNQDRSLSAAAVIFPAFLNIMKDVQTAAGGAATDGNPFHFDYSGQVSYGTDLYDDGIANGNPDPTPQSYSQELDLFGNTNQEVVTESTYSTFTQSASCTTTDAGVGGGTQSVNGIVATVTPVEGMVVDCTFVNKIKNATLTVKKNLTKDNGGNASESSFSIHVKTGSTSGTDVSGSPAAGSKTGTSYSLPAGTYYVCEANCDGTSGVSGYQLVKVVCDGAETNAVTLSAGGTKECTVYNDDVAPSLTLVKVVNNDHGGTAKPEEFTLKATGTTTSLNAKPGAGQNSISSGAGFYAGNYTLGEDTVTGYTAAGAYSCVVNGGTAVVNNSLTLALGDVATCTITNNDAKAAPSGETVQRAILHDKITITGLRSGGSGTVKVTFRLYSDNACSAFVGSEEITGAIPGNGEVTTVTGVGPVAKSATITAYYWRVEYSGDSYNEGFNTACSNEITTISFNK